MQSIIYILCILPCTVTVFANDDSIKLLEHSNNQFTAKMFSEITKANPEQSVILSGIAVMPPLAQIALASVGESHDELLEAISMPDEETTKSVFSYANKELQSLEGITLKMASKIYVANNYELNNNFIATSKEVFNSEVQNINFEETENAADEINAWVEEKTDHLITDLVDPNSLSRNTRAFLVNAIYFKGIWQNQFDKAVTENKDFYVDKNNVIKIPMMYNEGTYGYVESDELDAQILEIAYNGSNASMIIVLPYDTECIIELEEKLKDPNILDNSLKQLYETEVEVNIPKFKIETTTDLRSVLKKINIEKMFDSGSAKIYNLLNSANDLYINSAVQKAFIEINEEGVEAGASSGFGIKIRSPLPVSVFNADRPFYFAIKINSLILFNGVMYGS